MRYLTPSELLGPRRTTLPASSAICRRPSRTSCLAFHNCSKRQNISTAPKASLGTTATSGVGPLRQMLRRKRMSAFRVIVLQKSFCTGDQQFCGLQVRLSCKDVGDLITSCLNSQATSVTRLRSYRSAIASRFWFSRKIRSPATFDFCNKIRVTAEVHKRMEREDDPIADIEGEGIGTLPGSNFDFPRLSDTTLAAASSLLEQTWRTRWRHSPAPMAMTASRVRTDFNLSSAWEGNDTLESDPNFAIPSSTAAMATTH